MPNLRATEIKAFVPAKNFELLASRFCADSLAENFMMHLLVEDVDAWWARIEQSGVVARYGVKLFGIEQQPWRMRDFCITDPSGVRWRIGQKTD